MNVSLNYLKEYVNLDDSIDIKEICDSLTMTGTKVEKYEKFGKKVTKVYTGKVMSVVRHPLNNKLKKVTLNLGLALGEYFVVANIPDIEEGQIVPVALEGASIPNKQVTVGEIDGILSNAMICHISDFSLNKELYPAVHSSGLITFPASMDLGLDINEVLGLEDYIIEFEITPNRPDCLSVEGLARELSATFKVPLVKKLWQDEKAEFNKVDSVDNITVNIDTDNCLRYMLSVANNVKIGELPFDMQIKLIKSGFSIINNIVDITNYVMLEVGSPLHAFDSKIIGNEINVRMAKDNEELEMLDNTTKLLTSNNMVVAGKSSAISVAGVMGGIKSGINNNTKTVAFESATFVRGSVRNTAKALSIRTDASTRYEKGLSSRFANIALNRVYDLVISLEIGEMNLEAIDEDYSGYISSMVIVEYEKINKILGLNLEEDVINDILKSLNIKVENKIAMIPYYREDITITEDLAEEVARIYGYDKLLSTLPKTEETFAKFTDMQKFENDIKDVCLNKGLSEIYTYSFFSRNTLNKATLGKDDTLNNLVKLSNPLSIDFEFMRTTTIPHMLEALQINNNNKNSNVKLFELGKVFLNAENIKNGDLVNERNYITLGMYGDETLDFYSIKNIVMSMLNKYKVKYKLSRSTNVMLHPGISADVFSGDKLLASIGKVNPKTIANYELPENTYIAVIYLQELFDSKVNEFKYVELPKYPAVERDIALLVNDKTLSSDLIDCMKEVSYLVEDVKLFDVYKGSQIAENMKSMAYKVVLRDKEKTLNENDIKETIDNLLNTLKDKFGASIRS